MIPLLWEVTLTGKSIKYRKSINCNGNKLNVQPKTNFEINYIYLVVIMHIFKFMPMNSLVISYEICIMCKKNMKLYIKCQNFVQRTIQK
jgi:hypothetical protein